MAISLFMGRDLPTAPTENCYQTVQQFLGRFAGEFGEVNCFRLTGVHLGTPEGQAEFKERGRINQCTEYVGEAVRMVLELVE